MTAYSIQWREAKSCEYDALIMNQTWLLIHLTDLPDWMAFLRALVSSHCNMSRACISELAVVIVRYFLFTLMVSL